MGFIIQNLPTMLVAGVVFGGILLVAQKLYRDKKAGKHGCAGCKGCTGCTRAKGDMYTP